MTVRLPVGAARPRTPYMWLEAVGGPWHGQRIQVHGGLGTEIVVPGAHPRETIADLPRRSPLPMPRAIRGRYVVVRRAPHGLALDWRPNEDYIE